MPDKPTPRQVAFLESCGISVPPGKSTARNLINYLIQGNATGGETLSERIAILKAAENRFLGKQVRSKTHNNTGLVRYMTARTRNNVHNLRAVGVANPAAFEPVVEWNADGKAKKGTRAISLRDIELIEEPQEP